MANLFLGKVWVIDTASPVVINDDQHTCINAIHWVSPTAATAGDNLEITDAADNVIVEMVCTGTTQFQYLMHFTSPLDLRSTGGIKVKTLDSGKAYIYTE